MSIKSTLRPLAQHIRSRQKRRRRSAFLKRIPPGGLCAEIGVWKGEFSRLILEVCRPRELHLIDPWAFQADVPGRWYSGTIARSQADMDAIHQGVVDALGKVPGVSIHRRFSRDAAELFEERSLDWVYIDGDHSHEGALDDLRTYATRVRRGGFLAGDDLYWKPQDGHPVKRAVDDFVAGGGAELIALVDDQFLLRVP